MAEFGEVMRQWKRMCNYYTERAGNDHDACAICKFEGNGSNCLAVYEDSEPDTAEVERVVMSWAAEHPEPVYPTWGEWLISVGAARKIPTGIPFELLDGRIVDSPCETVVDVNTPIPAEIAEKLGIQPKEG